MTGAALVAAFLLSLAPGVVGRLAGPLWGLDSIPWTPLALLPWIALAGLPRRRGHAPAAASVTGLLLPPLALALASDLGAGSAVGATWAVAAWGTLLCAALALAASRGGALHAGLWWLTVPATALLLAARTFVGELPPGGGLASALATSPLAWPLRTLEALRSPGAGALPVPVGPLAVAALLIVAGGSGRSPRDNPEQGTP